MVLTEIYQNAVEHGFAGEPGEITTSCPAIAAGRLQVLVDDDGRGLPDDFDPTTARATSGCRSCRTLVESELDGAISLGSSPVGAAPECVLDIPLRYHRIAVSGAAKR